MYQQSNAPTFYFQNARRVTMETVMVVVPFVQTTGSNQIKVMHRSVPGNVPIYMNQMMNARNAVCFSHSLFLSETKEEIQIISFQPIGERSTP